MSRHRFKRHISDHIAGSNPLSSTIFNLDRGVAQSGSTTVLGTVYRRFKSYHPSQFFVNMLTRAGPLRSQRRPRRFTAGLQTASGPLQKHQPRIRQPARRRVPFSAEGCSLTEDMER